MWFYLNLWAIYLDNLGLFLKITSKQLDLGSFIWFVVDNISVMQVKNTGTCENRVHFEETRVIFVCNSFFMCKYV